MNEFSIEQLRAMLAEAETAATVAAETAVASERIGDELRAMVERAAALTAGASAAGLAVPDLASVLASAVERVAPVSPETLAAIVAPEPAPEPAPVRGTDGRRPRKASPERDMTRIASGSIWTGSVQGISGRVKITVDTAGRAAFTATTGNRGTFRSPTRALQSACGDPTTDAPSVAGRGSNLATVNGWIELRNADGERLDTAVRV